MLRLVVIPLLIVVCLVLVIRNQRQSDALFLLTVGGSGFAFSRGVKLLGPLHPDDKWPGVALIAVRLTVTLVACIAFTERSRSSGKRVSETAKESTMTGPDAALKQQG